MPEQTATERSKAIDLAVSQIEKRFYKGAIMRLGTKDPLVPVEVIPTGAISFDSALGVGGFPRGRVVEVFGPEASGKTTIALHVVAEAQKRGGMAAFVDAEHALDAAYAKKLGVCGVKSVLGIHKGRHAAALLRLGYDVQGNGGLPARFRAKDFHHAAARKAPHTERRVE